MRSGWHLLHIGRWRLSTLRSCPLTLTFSSPRRLERRLRRCLWAGGLETAPRAGKGRRLGGLEAVLSLRFLGQMDTSRGTRFASHPKVYDLYATVQLFFQHLLCRRIGNRKLPRLAAPPLCHIGLCACLLCRKPCKPLSRLAFQRSILGSKAVVCLNRFFLHKATLSASL